MLTIPLLITFGVVVGEPTAWDTRAPQPVVAVFAQGAFESGPLLTGDAPIFVLYDDGTVIYCARRTAVYVKEQVVEFLTVRLSFSEVEELRGSLALDSTFFPLRHSYTNAPHVYDMPHFVIWAWHDGVGKEVDVYGSVDTTSIGWHDKGDTVPRAFIRLYDQLCAFRHPRAQPWHPSAYELYLYDLKYPVDSALPWPQDWSGKVRVDSSGKQYVQITPSQFEAFRQMYGSRLDSNSYSRDGKTWAVFARIVFPEEEFWTPGYDGRPN